MTRTDPVRWSPLTAVLAGGGTAGCLDILYAMVANALHGRSPLGAVRAVASGLLGAEAFSGGAGPVLLGLALHFVIALSAAAAFYLASRFLPFLRKRALLSAAAFGPLVYLFMHFVVLPLSAVPFTLSYTPRVFAFGFASHILFVALPIALAVGRTAPPVTA